MLLGGLMEKSLANSPNIVWGAREETEIKTTEIHMVLGNGQQPKMQKQRTESSMFLVLSYSGTSLEVLK